MNYCSSISKRSLFVFFNNQLRKVVKVPLASCNLNSFGEIKNYMYHFSIIFLKVAFTF